METVTTTTVTERRIIRQEQNFYPQNVNQCPVNGILKGGKMWKQSSLEFPINDNNKQQSIVSIFLLFRDTILGMIGTSSKTTFKIVSHSNFKYKIALLSD